MPAVSSHANKYSYGLTHIVYGTTEQPNNKPSFAISSLKSSNYTNVGETSLMQMKHWKQIIEDNFLWERKVGWEEEFFHFSNFPIAILADHGKVANYF